ncbi:hypothetical protein [Brytella acorum]|uniref:Uncharacterized protein n=1 Tax=Brytella acorum TaxID=2959299 RepID=A0AA35ULB9_9PROT|nr:hypothetical protein [Brytella acorum]CAI9119542.1 hypothetical protein LMG32879_000359 [Brytella acorum]
MPDVVEFHKSMALAYSYAILGKVMTKSAAATSNDGLDGAKPS